MSEITREFRDNMSKRQTIFRGQAVIDLVEHAETLEAERDGLQAHIVDMQAEIAALRERITRQHEDINILERKMVIHVRLSAEATEGIRAALKASTIQLAHMATGFPVNPDDLKTQVETNYKVMK